MTERFTESPQFRRMTWLKWGFLAATIITGFWVVWAIDPVWGRACFPLGAVILSWGFYNYLDGITESLRAVETAIIEEIEELDL